MNRTPSLEGHDARNRVRGVLVSLHRTVIALFSKAGMTLVPWGAGTTPTIGSTDAGAAAIALRFVHDATRMARHSRRSGTAACGDGTITLFDNSATVPQPSEPKALWKAVFRLVDADTPIELLALCGHPIERSGHHPVAPRSILFQWTGASLPDPLCNSFFWMELRADIDAQKPSRVEWQSRLGRVARPGNPNRYTLDEVTAPIVHVDAPLG